MDGRILPLGWTHKSPLCIHTYTYLPTYLSIYLSTYLPIPTYTYLYLPIPTYTYLYIPIYLHTYSHTCMHACNCTSRLWFMLVLYFVCFSCFPAIILAVIHPNIVLFMSDFINNTTVTHPISQFSRFVFQLL